VASDWLTEAALPSRRAVTLAFVNDVVDAAKTLADPYSLAAALNARYFVARTQYLPQRRQWALDLRDAAEALGLDEWIFQARLAYLIESVAIGDSEGVAEGLGKLRETCDRYRVPRAMWVCELSAGTCARLRGDFDVADAHTDSAAALGDRHGLIDAAAATGAAAFLNAFHRGRLESLRPILEKFAEAVPEIAAWTFGAGIAALADHDGGAAREALVRGMRALTEDPEEIWLPSLCLGAELAGRIGADAAILARLTRLLKPYSGEFAIVGTLISEFGPTDRALGILNAAAGDMEAAAAHFGNAVALCRRLGAGPWHVRTHVDWLVAERNAGLPQRPWWTEIEQELTTSELIGSRDRLCDTFVPRRRGK